MKSFKYSPWNWVLRERANADAPSRESGPYTRFVPALPLSMELDRLFDTFFSGYFPQARARAVNHLGEAAIRPDLDISGDDKRYLISVELPGVSEQDLNVELENNTLRISGEKRYEHNSQDALDGSDDQGKNFYRIERSYGSFQRVLELPDDVDTEAISASHKDGVLTITMPRKAAVLQNTKRIAINQD